MYPQLPPGTMGAPGLAGGPPVVMQQQQVLLGMDPVNMVCPYCHASVSPHQ